MITSILITKSPEPHSVLQQFCAALAIPLQMQSFIRFERVDAVLHKAPEVLFFGSKNAVDFYRMQFAIPPDSRIACIGKATQKHLEQLGFSVDFTGKKAGDPESVASDLKSWLGNRHLHIALAANSHRSMLQDLPESQFTAIIVYKTLLQPMALHSVPHCLVFTSPSNVAGFLLSNTIPPGSQVVAWGQTTAAFLAQQHIRANLVLQSASEEELVLWLEASATN